MSKLINVSEAVSIAIHSLAVIARSEAYLNGTDIVKLTGYSKNHTAKVLQSLVRYKFLESERGPKGGFKLINLPADITFMSVYKVIEGDFEIQGHCKHKKEECLFTECVFGPITHKLSAEFEAYLLNKTIGDLI